MKGMQEVGRKVEQMLGFEGKPKNAIDLIKADHRKVEDLFKTFKSARAESRKQQLVDQIIMELAVHSTMEEDLVYPLLEDMGKDLTQKAYEAEEEHKMLKMALAELADTRMDCKHLNAKMKVLEELVKHHVKEEERELLPKLKKSGMCMNKLADQIRARKDKLIYSMSFGGGIGKNKDRKLRAGTSQKSMAQIGKSGAAPLRKEQIETGNKRAFKLERSQNGASKSSMKSTAASTKSSNGTKAASSKGSNGTQAASSKGSNGTKAASSKSSAGKTAKSSSTKSRSSKRAIGKSSSGHKTISASKAARKGKSGGSQNVTTAKSRIGTSRRAASKKKTA